MSFKESYSRGGTRDDRRRRLLAEEIVGNTDSVISTSCEVESEGGREKNPGNIFFMNEEIRLIDLLPRRLPIITAFLTIGLACIAGLESLYGWQHRLSCQIPRLKLSAFDLSREGNLGNWFSSLVLLCASLAALAVFAVRRQKMDDYRGRYRIWFWAAGCWFFLATDVSTNLHENFKQIMIHATGTSLWGDGTAWWLGLYAVVFGALGWRLILDLRASALALITSLLGASAYLFAACLTLGLLSFDDPVKSTMLRSSAVMYAHLMVLVSMVLCARHVINQARAVCGAQDSQSARAPSQHSATSSRKFRVDAPSAAPRPKLERSATSAPVSSGNAYQASGASNTQTEATRKMTKQEKKRLRERLLRERLERQRSQGSAWR